MRSLFFAWLCLISLSSAHAARWQNAANTISTLNGLLQHNNSILSTNSYNLLEERSIKEADSTHIRYQQTFRNLPIWGKRVLLNVDKQNKILFATGTFVDRLEEDQIPAQPKLSSEEAWNIALQDHNNKLPIMRVRSNVRIRTDKKSLEIYAPKNEPARLIYVIQFLVQEPGTPLTRPLYVIDAESGKVIKKMESLTTNQNAEATGPGGNGKTGLIEYGVDFPAISAQISEADGQTLMNNENVMVVDCGNKTSCPSDPFEFAGLRNTHKEVNGAFSPINDAAFFGQVTFNMYKDWFEQKPLKTQLILQVHYGRNFENAFWDGKTMGFGDGASHFYPLVSLDVMAHEVSHGFTEFNSGLLYLDESGGINESFSDMAGEAAEFYARGNNDFLVGQTIFKDEGALRYLNDPPKDGRSIDNYGDYNSNLDVHYSSGIYNKAFYLLATSPGWDTKKAFNCFVRANQMYWEPETNFQSGAAGVLKAAGDLQFNTDDVKKAFSQVGIEI